MNPNKRKVLKRIFLVTVIIVVISYGNMIRHYALTIDDIESDFMQSFEYGTLNIRDKVVLKNSILYFYEAGDKRFGRFVFEKGPNGKYSHESLVRSESYYQENYLSIANDNYVVIVGMNPLSSEFVCEFNDSISYTISNREEFMIILQPPNTTELPFDSIVFKDRNGNDITQLVKML